MSKFKVGDKVKCIRGSEYMNLKENHEYEVIATYRTTIQVNKKIDSCDWCDEYRFEILKGKEQVFNIKTNPWFIRVNSKEEFEAAKKWLDENFGNYLDTGYETYIVGLSNTDDSGTIQPRVVWMDKNSLKATERYEIKLNFKAVVDSVEYPVIKSERDLKIEELEQSIKEAQERLNELKGLKL